MQSRRRRRGTQSVLCKKSVNSICGSLDSQTTPETHRSKVRLRNVVIHEHVVITAIAKNTPHGRRKINGAVFRFALLLRFNCSPWDFSQTIEENEFTRRLVITDQVVFASGAIHFMKRPKLIIVRFQPSPHLGPRWLLSFFSKWVARSQRRSRR